MGGKILFHELIRTEVQEKKTLPDKTSEEMERVSSYLEQHVGHMNYNCYKKSGLPKI